MASNTNNLEFQKMVCRKCDAVNPVVYFAPVSLSGYSTCICFDCADARQWLDKDGNLREGVEL